ncbi:unnamed protein product, partial [Closterium sp. Naga37s-1]
MFRKTSDVRGKQRLSGGDRKKLRRNIRDKFPGTTDEQLEAMILPAKFSPLPPLLSILRRLVPNPDTPTPCDLTPCDLTPCDLTPCDLTPCDLTPCDLTPCDLTPCDLTPCDLTPCDLTPCDLTPYDLTPCDLTPCDLTPCDLTPCDLTPCDLTPCDLTPCDLTPCDLTPCDLTPCDLTPYDLTRHRFPVFAQRSGPDLVPSLLLKSRVPVEGLPAFQKGEVWSVKVPGNSCPIAIRLPCSTTRLQRHKLSALNLAILPSQT